MGTYTPPSVEIEPTPGDSEWFMHDRFGMFIHWGIYACAGRHEWVKKYEQMTDAQYQKYFDHFYPDLYDPAEWARMARDAGMKYFVITTKHHDGFCLWDTDQTDYKVTNTPWGRDLIGPMVEAFRNEGLKVGFYYSLIDWHHPEFPVDAVHPQANDEEFLRANQDRDISKYADYLYAQTEELMTNFGKIDLIFFDFSYPQREGTELLAPGKGREDWQSERLVQMVREKQPGILINNRTDTPQDYWTPEQVQPEGWYEVDGKPVKWEACQTFSGSWGYYRDEHTWKSVPMLLRMLIDGVSKGGNLLLNVGPTARGTFDERAQARLRGIGEWMKLNSRSIYGCTMSDFPTPNDCRYTQNFNTGRLYCHIFAWPMKTLRLKAMAGKIEYAQLLHDASEIQFREDDGDVLLSLPIVKPPVEIPVVEMYLND